MTEIVVPCAACYGRLTVTKNQLAADAELNETITKANGLNIKDLLKS